jgi:glucose/arabinose dehydrogenase
MGSGLESCMGHPRGTIQDLTPSIDWTGRAWWSYGHRNPQGLARHPVTGELYEAQTRGARGRWASCP